MMRFRLVALTVSAMFCSGLALLALTHKILIMPEIDFSPPPLDMKSEPAPPEPPKTPPMVKPPEQQVMIAPIDPIENIRFTPDPVGPPAASQPAPYVITDPRWLKLPNGRDFERFYPTRALDREKAGRVVLTCVVQANGSIDCAVAEETPMGWGFSEAALQIAKSFRMAPQTVNGQPTSGGRVTVPIVFNVGG